MAHEGHTHSHTHTIKACEVDVCVVSAGMEDLGKTICNDAWKTICGHLYWEPGQRLVRVALGHSHAHHRSYRFSYLLTCSKDLLKGQKQPAHVTAGMCDNLEGLAKNFGLLGRYSRMLNLHHHLRSGSALVEIISLVATVMPWRFVENHQKASRFGQTWFHWCFLPKRELLSSSVWCRMGLKC